MDFALTEEMAAVRDLAAEVFADRAGESAWQEGARAGIDRGTWAALAEADLLGVALPEDAGGADMGFGALCALVEAAGRRAAPVPLLETLVLGARAVGDRSDLLDGVASGEALLTAGLVEPHRRDPREATTRATAIPGGWRLSGTKIAVPAFDLARWWVVPAHDGRGAALFAVPTDAPGHAAQRTRTTTGEPLWHVDMAGVKVDGAARLGGPERAERWFAEAVAAESAYLLGLADTALSMTARYATEREQFGRPIATFQAVSQRIADGWIDLQAAQVVVRQAVWRLEQGLPAAREVAIARYFATEAAHRITATAQHVHGGMGFDRDYPLFRYTLAVKRREFALGGSAAWLARVGEDVARRQPAGRPPT